MPYAEIKKGARRSTICSPEWPADTKISAPDRVPLGATTGMLFDIRWPTGREGRVTLTLQRASEAGGQVRFDGQSGPLTKEFTGNTTTFLTLFGATASPGEADVPLEVKIGDDARTPFRFSVGSVTATVAIQGANNAPAPSFVHLEQATALTAVVTPSAPAGSSYRWFVIGAAAGLTINQANPNAANVTVVAHSAATQERGIGVLVAGPEGSNLPAVMAVHRFTADDLEAAFTVHRLYSLHLQDVNFRRRLEEMSPEQVQPYLDAATDPAIRDYLERLLTFVTEQAPLRAAPTGDRERITFIMGRDGDPFYRAAHAHFTRSPAGTLVLPDQLTGAGQIPALSDVLDYLRNHSPANGRPWGEVNIVVHANEEGEADMPLSPLPAGQGLTWQNIASVFNLRRAVENNALTHLPDDLVDVRSTVRVRGCALGRSQESVELLSQIVGGTDAQRPTVNAPQHIQGYDFTPDTWQPHHPNPPARSDEFFVEFWFEGFPTGQRPSNATLIQRFTAQAGNIVNWGDALGRPGHPRGDLPANETRERTYDYTFEYGYDPQVEPDMPPTNNADRLAFLRDRTPDVVTDLARVGHTVDDYTWSFQGTTDVAVGNGLRRFNLVAHGSHTILRVQRELREPDPNNPGQTRRVYPAPSDTTHFGEFVPVRPPAHPLGENVLP